jgi:hypothetical protein
MVVKAIAAETWSCYHSNNGKDGARNHVETILFSDNRTDTAKTTRSAKTGQVSVPLRGVTPSSHRRPRCEQIGHTPPSAHEGGSKEGGVRLGKSIPALVEILRDLTSRLRHVECSLQVVGRLLRDVGCIPGNVSRVRQEVGGIFSTVSFSLLLPFSRERKEEKRKTAATRNEQDSARLC